MDNTGNIHLKNNGTISISSFRVTAAAEHFTGCMPFLSPYQTVSSIE